MLRAWRINRYGSTNSKVIRQEVASRPRGKAAAASGGKRAGGSARAGAGKTSGQPGDTPAPDGKQALHAQSAASQEDPEADPVGVCAVRPRRALSAPGPP